jgi:hypothetical protein
MMAQRLSDRLGQAFVVENKGGGGGSVAADFVEDHVIQVILSLEVDDSELESRRRRPAGGGPGRGDLDDK